LRCVVPESGEWHEEAKKLAPVSCYDPVLSCPKSVSLLHALTDDERIQREISNAHEAAWRGALGYLEREAPTPASSPLWAPEASTARSASISAPSA